MTSPQPMLRHALVAGALAVALAGCAAPLTVPSAQPAASKAGSVAPTTQQPTPSATPRPSHATSTPTASQGPTASPSSASKPPSCPAAASSFIEQAPGSGKTVALTFDDGPGPNDQAIVEVLDRYGVHASFFLTGAHAAANPDNVRFLAAHGELLGDHTWDHNYPFQVHGGWNQPYLVDQFQRTDAQISQLSGQPVCFVRPPGGFRTNVLAAGHQVGLSAVLWSTDSLDWRQPARTTASATSLIVSRATSVGHNEHPIVLMHSAKASHEPEAQVSSNRGNTIAALPKIIEWYKSHGYRFVRLDGRS